MDKLSFLPTFLLLPSSLCSLNFKILRLAPGAADILYEGDAISYMGTVVFNDVKYLCRVGRVIYSERIRIWDSGSRKQTNFSTHFSFFIDTRGASSYGHGLAFFLAPEGFQIPPNSVGGFLGLFNTTTTDSNSTNQMIVVEFNSFNNSEWDPPLGEHVGINVNSIFSAKYAAWNASQYSGQTANTWITCNATTKNLSVFWTYESNPVFQGNSLLSHTVDLMKVLPEWAIVGFSAATCINIERHVLQTWEFNSSLEVKETQGKNERKTKLVVGLVIPISAVLIGGIGTVIVILLRRHRRSKNEREEVNYTSIIGDLERGAAGPRKFSYRQLASATQDFSDGRKLGGRFGCVYRGFLSDINAAVAVKNLQRIQTRQEAYVTEVKTISQLRHWNLVQLIGWCHDRGEFLLVHEFNGSLDSHLSGKKGPLNWETRYKISLGLASALSS